MDGVDCEQKYELYCGSLKQNYIVSHGATNDLSPLSLILLSLSSCTCFIYGLIMRSNKKMQETDSGRALMFLAIVEAFYALTMVQSYLACDVGLPSLYAATVFIFSSESEDQQELRSVHMLAQASQFWNLFLWTEIVFLHFFIMVDVINKLRSPMSVKKVNLGIRVAINSVMLIIFCLAVLDYSGFIILNQEGGHDTVVLVVLCFFYILAIMTIISFFCMNKMLGLGKKAKS